MDEVKEQGTMIGCLCIHGFTGGAYEVEPLEIFLKEHTNWEVVVPVLPGHGEELELDGVTYQEWIEKAEASLRLLKNKCETIYIVGFSMGGMIASYLASKYDVEKLVLLSTSRKYISIRQMAIDISGFVKEGITGELNENKLYQRYMKKRGSVPIKSIVEFLRCMRYTKPSLKEVTCPTLVVQGIQDGMVPYKSAKYLDKEIPANTEVIYFHDSKHHICLGDDKDTLVQAVYSFLTRENQK